MRIIHALCTVKYSGRGETMLSPYDRVIIHKSDGSIAIHSDTGFKPLNYMTGAKNNVFTENAIGDTIIWKIENPKEYLVITMHKIYSDSVLHVGTADPGLEHDRTEAQLQDWLEENISEIIPGMTCIHREYATENGPVDLLCSYSGQDFLVEVKRVATTGAVHQVKRYLEGATNLSEPGMMIIAYDVRPKTREKAQKMGISWVELESDAESGAVMKDSFFTWVGDK